LISWSLGLPFGDWSTDTSARVPPLTFTWTWTGPHWVWATVPLTVRADDPVDDSVGGGSRGDGRLGGGGQQPGQRGPVAEQQHHHGDRAQQPIDNALHRQVTT
jgi:hypothetical protein